MTAPFPWFGGKSRIADEIWSAFGADVANYVEPFCGSAAVLLARPYISDSHIETINDADGFVANFWRAMTADPEAVAYWAEWPVNECLIAGTMIATPSGPMPIESIKPGMIVYGERDGYRVETRVIATKRSKAHELFGVGSSWMTGNHPVWTQELGYVEARQLVPGLHVAIVDWIVDKIDLVMLYSPCDQSRLGNLLSVRPAHYESALCRSDISWQGQIQGAHLPGRNGPQDASGLLDSLTHHGKASSDLCAIGDWHRRELARARTVLDCEAQTDADEPHRRRGRNAWLHPEFGPEAEMVSHAGGCTIRPGPAFGYAWSEAFSGGYRENQTSRNRESDASEHEGKGFGCSQGQAIDDRASRETCHSEAGQTVDRGAPTENRCINQNPQASSMRRDGRNFPFSDPCSAGFGSSRGWDLSGNSKGLPLQRKSLPHGVAVYNFQTDTGNFFANGLLVHNCDLHARHAWLVNRRARLTWCLEDPDWFDPKIAGWWLWGCCIWIGSGWCSGEGPWLGNGAHIQDSHPLPHLGDAGNGINRKLPHLGNAGRGINRQLPHLGDAGSGINLQLPHLGNAGRGINRKLPHLGDARNGINRKLPHLGNAGRGKAWEHLQPIAARLRNVRVCSGDWMRVLGPTPTTNLGTTAVLLDPPYSDEAARSEVYAVECGQVAHRARDWCLANGDNPELRIALCGYAGEGHEALMAKGWTVKAWKASGGYGSQSDDDDCNSRVNSTRERVWFSPHCLLDYDLFTRQTP